MPISTKDIILFFLSSVLVSSDAPSTPERMVRMNFNRKKEDEEISARGSDEEAGAEHVSIEGLPAQLLHSSWTFWYDSKVKKGLQADEYMKAVKNAGTFQTLQTFWSCWSEVVQICNVPLGSEVNYHLFKSGIKPVWEDPKNSRGGKFVFITPRTSTDATLKQWVSLMLSLIMGDLGNDDEICGAVLSVRSWGNMFTIWNRNARNKTAIDNLGGKIKELFETDHIKYQRHQYKMKKPVDGVDRPKRSYGSDDSGASDHSSSDEQENSTRPRRGSPVTESTRGFLRQMIADIQTPIPAETAAPVPLVNVALPDAEDEIQVAPATELPESSKIIQETKEEKEEGTNIEKEEEKVIDASRESKNKRRRRKKTSTEKRKAIPTKEEETETKVIKEQVVVPSTAEKRIVVTRKKEEGMPTFLRYGLIALLVVTIATSFLRFAY